MTAAKIRLTLAVILFVAWVGWLGWQTRHVDDVVVSRAQVAAADCLIVAKLTAGDDGKPAGTTEVIEVLRCTAGVDPIPVGESMEIRFLSEGKGFVGEGEYLLPLAGGSDGYQLAPIPPFPSYGEPRPPRMYPWSRSVRGQIAEWIEG